MNRETKRLMARRPEPDEPEFEDEPAPRAVRPAPRPEFSAAGRVVEFGREVRSELRQVAWPTRSEVANAAAVVLLVLVLLTSVIFGLNYAFSHGVIDLLSP